MGNRKLNLRSLNLNLLVVFDAIMTERNVTKAGWVLSLSQSAVSNALAQLRLVLGDALFVRVKNEMVPTAHALTLAEPVRAALAQLRSAIRPVDTFVPTRSTRLFRVGMCDYSAFVLLGPLMKHIRRQSPGVKICAVAVDPANIAVAVDNDEADICLGFSGSRAEDERHRTQVLFKDDWVCARARSASAPFTLESYLAANHIVVGDRLYNHVDRLLKELGRARRNVVSLPFCLAAPALVEGSDMVLTLPRRLAREFSRGRAIEICELPFETRGFPVSMLWHVRVDRDPGIQWLTQIISEAIVPTSNSHSAVSRLSIR